MVCLTVSTTTSDYYLSVNAPPLPPVWLHVNRALRRKEGEKTHWCLIFSILTAFICCLVSQMLLLSQPFCVAWFILSC